MCWVHFAFYLWSSSSRSSVSCGPYCVLWYFCRPPSSYIFVSLRSDDESSHLRKILKDFCASALLLTSPTLALTLYDRDWVSDYELTHSLSIIDSLISVCNMMAFGNSIMRFGSRFSTVQVTSKIEQSIVKRFELAGSTGREFLSRCQGLRIEIEVHEPGYTCRNTADNLVCLYATATASNWI